MATYGGWTEVREYRVWLSDETYSVVSVDKHKNGWFGIFNDGPDDWARATRSESAAFGLAKERAEFLETEAKGTCPCKAWEESERLECANGEFDTYNNPHSVRIQVVDEIENRDITGDL